MVMGSCEGVFSSKKTTGAVSADHHLLVEREIVSSPSTQCTGRRSEKFDKKISWPMIFLGLKTVSQMLHRGRIAYSLPHPESRNCCIVVYIHLTNLPRLSPREA